MHTGPGIILILSIGHCYLGTQVLTIRHFSEIQFLLHYKSLSVCLLLTASLFQTGLTWFYPNVLKACCFITRPFVFLDLKMSRHFDHGQADGAAVHVEDGFGSNKSRSSAQTWKLTNGETYSAFLGRADGRNRRASFQTQSDIRSEEKNTDPGSRSVLMSDRTDALTTHVYSLFSHSSSFSISSLFCQSHFSARFRL